jgi:hypothetical protein
VSIGRQVARSAMPLQEVEDNGGVTPARLQNDHLGWASQARTSLQAAETGRGSRKTLLRVDSRIKPRITAQQSATGRGLLRVVSHHFLAGR